MSYQCSSGDRAVVADRSKRLTAVLEVPAGSDEAAVTVALKVAIQEGVPLVLRSVSSVILSLPSGSSGTGEMTDDPTWRETQ